jgi:hypothetical protein
MKQSVGLLKHLGNSLVLLQAKSGEPLYKDSVKIGKLDLDLMIH